MAIVQQKHDGQVIITLNRPEALNAITIEMLQELAQALLEAQDPLVRLVVITGAGRAFSVGQDLKEVEGGEKDYQSHLQPYNLVVRRIRDLKKPVVAVVNGVAAGAGFSLALACDIRLAASNASFTTAFSRLALVPDTGMTYFLPRLVGWGKALDLMVYSPRISADEALRLGIVQRVSPVETLQEEVQAFIAELAQGPTYALGLLKQALQRSFTATLDEVLEYEAVLQGMAGRSRDHTEGFQAFLEKRDPRFTGE
jgi:2-(1,2-epoxy-1,2-dihydrophenyl)acetyl-CoA isomerase